MIIAIIGGVGSGKTLSAVRNILKQDKKAYINFKVKSKKAYRLKKEDILNEYFVGKKKTYEVNWDFWENAKNKGNFDIYLDEVHQLFNSRKSMTGWNVAGTTFISQIRKLMDSSEDSNIYLLTQKLTRLDVAWRDLLHGIVFCQKVKKGKEIIIMQYCFFGRKIQDPVVAYNQFLMGAGKTYDYRKPFLANPYFNYYDSYEMVKDTAYL
ncbi:MAG: zonular occludens toxin domain-containing protein [Candidatus Izemoplasmatales bacterium]